MKIEARVVTASSLEELVEKMIDEKNFIFFESSESLASFLQDKAMPCLDCFKFCNQRCRLPHGK